MVPTSGYRFLVQMENNKMQNLWVQLKEAKAESPGKRMRSGPEPKPQLVAVAAFYVEPVASNRDKKMGEESIGSPGPSFL